MAEEKDKGLQSLEMQVEASNSFFDELNKQVSGGFFSDDSGSDKGLGNNMPSLANADDPKGKKDDDSEVDKKYKALSEKYEQLQKQYTDSSTEAQRLNQEVNTLKPLVPILERARTNPEHVAKILSALNEETPVSIRERLGLDDEFEFDANSAVMDPSSDSGKVFYETINSVIRAQVGSALEKQNDVLQRQLEEERFKSKHKMSDKEWEEYKEFANQKRLELDDILYLKNREKIEETISRKAAEETLNKLKQNRGRSISLAAIGGQESGPDDDISIFNKVFPGVLKRNSFFD